MATLGGWRRVKRRKCLITGRGIRKAKTTIKIVIPLVHSFFLAKIQIIYLFANSFARAGWLVRSVRGGGGGGGGGEGGYYILRK